ncbi:MAG: hypothetical protein ABFD46_06315 [Armatimonadota bacterium]
MKSKLFVVVALLLAFTAAVSAQDKVQTDPAEKPDTRLDQKVTHQAKEQFLYKVLDELTEKTGVVMNCGKNKKDWQVRETKVNIFIKDMSLKDLQQNLAKLLHYTWAKSTKDGVTSYRLYQTLKSKKEEEKLRTDAKEAKARKRMETRKKALDELERVVALSPEEIDKLQVSSPLQYVFAKDPIGKVMVGLLNAVPEAKSALLEGREVSIPISRMSPEAKAAVTKYRQAFQGFVNRFDPSETSEDDSAELDKDSQLTISQQDESIHSYDPFPDTILGSVDLEGVDMPLFNFENPVAKAMGKMIAAMYDGGTELSRYDEEQIEKEMSQLAAKSLEQPDALKSEPDDPDLVKAAKLDVSEYKGPSDLLKEVAAKTELQVISDYFDDGIGRLSMMYSTSPAKPGDTVGSILKYAAIICNKRAVKTGKVVTFEDREWFEKRTWAVPDEWMERWRQLVKEGNLSLDDLADMVCFTDDQLKHTICEAGGLIQYSSTIEDNKDILRLYAVLTNSQKKVLQTDEGLDPASLNENQWAFYAYLAAQSKISFSDNRGMMIPMTLLLKADEKEKCYEFSLLSRRQNAANEELQYPVRTWGVYLKEPDLDEESIDEMINGNNPSASPAPEAPAGQPNAPQP